MNGGLTSYDKDKFDQSPYDVAVAKNKYECIELFNKLKNDKVYQSKIKKSALTLAIVMNEIDKASSLIPISDVNQKDIFENSPLFYAILNSETILVEELLNNDASIYNIDGQNDDAIYYATIVGNLDIVKLIQKKNVDYNKKYGGYSVIEYAKLTNNKELHKTLKKGAE